MKTSDEREENPSCATNVTNGKSFGVHGQHGRADIVCAFRLSHEVAGPSRAPVRSYGNVSMASHASPWSVPCLVSRGRPVSNATADDRSSSTRLEATSLQIFSRTWRCIIGVRTCRWGTQVSKSGRVPHGASLGPMGSGCFSLHDGRHFRLAWRLAPLDGLRAAGGRWGAACSQMRKKVNPRGFMAKVGRQKQEILNSSRNCNDGKG